MKLSEHQSGQFVKMLLVGDSGSGKTGALVSLVKAGYKLRIIDYDNGLDALAAQIREQCPDRLDSVEFETCQDAYRTTRTGETVLKGTPKALMRSGALLDKWIDGSSPKDWGPDYVLVLDSITSMGRAAYAVAQTAKPMARDRRNWYFDAQGFIEDIAVSVTSILYRTNVILISHIDTQEVLDGQGKVTDTRKYVSTIGRALGGKFPRHVNTLIQADIKLGKRLLVTMPTHELPLKNPMPHKLPKTLPLNEGLATIFEALTGRKAVKP